MTYSRFEDLPVWKAAIELAVRVYALTDHPAFEGLEGRRGGDLSDQLRRASLSISNNIAEGFERGSTPDLLNFLYIARGSAAETRSMLHFALRLPILKFVVAEVPPLIQLAEGCSRQLRAWLDSLQNSAIKGQRHLNNATRESYLAHDRSEAFLKKLRAMTPHLDSGAAPCQVAPNPQEGQP
jgi:four helix bundle protein